VTGFPIAENEATYRKLVKGGKIDGMRESAIKRINAFAPYKGGNDALWRIHELDNADKHRLLLTVYRDCLFFTDWQDPNRPFLLKTDDPHFAGLFDEQVEQDLETEVDETFNQAQIPQSNALFPSLHQLTDFVYDFVPGFLPDLEPLVR
jgi:hypothetical protein